MDEYVPELQENVDTCSELRDKTIAVRDGGSCRSNIYQQSLTEPTVIFKTLQIHWSTQKGKGSHEQLTEQQIEKDVQNN